MLTSDPKCWQRHLRMSISAYNRLLTFLCQQAAILKYNIAAQCFYDLLHTASHTIPTNRTDWLHHVCQCLVGSCQNPNLTSFTRNGPLGFPGFLSCHFLGLQVVPDMVTMRHSQNNQRQLIKSSYRVPPRTDSCKIAVVPVDPLSASIGDRVTHPSSWHYSSSRQGHYHYVVLMPFHPPPPLQHEGNHVMLALTLTFTNHGKTSDAFLQNS